MNPLQRIISRQDLGLIGLPVDKNHEQLAEQSKSSVVQVNDPNLGHSSQSNRFLTQPFPPESFLSELKDIDSKKKALTTYPEVFEWYPDLKELAERMLAFGSFNNVRVALEEGVMAPSSGRDEKVRINELRKTDPKKAERLELFFKSVLVNDKIISIKQELAKDGYSIESEEDLLKLQQIKPEVVNEILVLRKEQDSAITLLRAEFDGNAYSNDFGIVYAQSWRCFRFDAECGELLGYKPEDILVYGVRNFLPGGIYINDKCNDDRSMKTKITDWDFVKAFYENAQRWKLYSNTTVT